MISSGKHGNWFCEKGRASSLRLSLLIGANFLASLGGGKVLSAGEGPSLPPPVDAPKVGSKKWRKRFREELLEDKTVQEIAQGMPVPGITHQLRSIL